MPAPTAPANPPPLRSSSAAFRGVDEFVNADVIAKEEGVSGIKAGRRTLARLEALAADHRNIAFETTLASRMLLPRIQAMQEVGHIFPLMFFWLPTADMAIQRVAGRVAAGGHSIPEDVIRRPYDRGLDNLFNAYLVAADTWVVMNNTKWQGRPIAWREIGATVHVADNELWNDLVSRYVKPRAEEPQPATTGQDELERLRRIFDPQDIVDGINRAVYQAVKRHKERGESIIIWQDGAVKILTADEIDLSMYEVPDADGKQVGR